MAYQTIRAAWHWVSQMPAWLALVVLVLVAPLAGLIWQRLSGDPRQARWLAGATLLFGLIDLAMLLMLPRLGLSFGPAGVPLFGITLVRAALVLALSWLVSLLATRWPNLPGLTLALALQLGITGCAFYGLYIEPFNLGVTRITVETSKPLPQRALRIVQLSDLHVERTTRREREMVETVRGLEPDLIVLTGDYLSTSDLDNLYAWVDLSWLLNDLQAPLGVYAILAQPGDSDKMVATVFGSVDVTVIPDMVVRVGPDPSALTLVGVTFSDPSGAGDATRLQALMGQVPPETFTLVLYHPPDLAPLAAELGADLYLCGHTHGGQIRLPLYGALFTASRHGKRFEMGRYQVGEMTLYVSRGLGMEGQGAPRARFLAPPEIVVVDLVSTAP